MHVLLVNKDGSHLNKSDIPLLSAFLDLIKQYHGKTGVIWCHLRFFKLPIFRTNFHFPWTTLDIKRMPRSMLEHLKYWKATELRSSLLFYGAPVLYFFYVYWQKNHLSNITKITTIFKQRKWYYITHTVINCSCFVWNSFKRVFSTLATAGSCHGLAVKRFYKQIRPQSQ